MRCGRTFRLARTHRAHTRSSGLANSLADYTIDMDESEFSEATGAVTVHILATKENCLMQNLSAETTRDLFTPIEVGPLTLPNRIVMAPLTRSRAGPGNVPTPLSALYYAQRASAGLIISEATQVAPEGQGYISTPGIYSAEQVAGWKCVTSAVHACSGRMV